MRSLIGRQVGPLEIERARHRVGGTRERGDEAVAFTLLDRAYAIVLSNDLVGCAVQKRERGRHRGGLRFP